MIPFEEFGGSGPVLHFGHANGYPPGAYRALFERLAGRFRVLAMRMRPLWPDASPDSLRDWRPLADDLEDFLEQHSLDTLVGAGHSMGATTALRLALRQPERFSALVLVDPVFFPPRSIRFWSLVNRLGLSYRLHPLVKGALKRRSQFDSQEVMFANYRQKAVFSRIDDAGLHAYVDALACPQEDGSVKLCYTPAWEARIYLTGVCADMELWRALHTLKPPLLIIRGADTDTFWEETARLVQRRLPSARIVTLPDATHLAPLEQPLRTAEWMLDFLSE